MEFVFGDVSASVQVSCDGTAVLSWTDGLNEWREVFSSLPVALCRLGALAECARGDWWAGFVDSAEVFNGRAVAFLEGVVR